MGIEGRALLCQSPFGRSSRRYEVISDTKNALIAARANLGGTLLGVGRWWVRTTSPASSWVAKVFSKAAF